jgi:enoyl-CoA hydratase
MTAAPEIRFERRGHLGIVTLDRPRALNALSLAMCRAMRAALAAWGQDDAVAAVVVRSAGGRAFCAGGDVRALYDLGRDAALAATRDPETDYFRQEYLLDHAVRRFPKPYVALMDGVTMGGGAGISVHGSHAVATERTLFAMPECVLGFFADVGSAWFLARCPGETGTWIALSGARLHAADLLHAGLAAAHVPSDALDGLVDALAAADWATAPQATADAVIRRFATPPGPAPLAGDRAWIDRCFAGDDVARILAALDAEDSPGSALAAAEMRRASPTSLTVTLRLLRFARVATYEAVAAMDYRLARRALEGPDLYEGIRAVLVDKDRAPRWQPARLDQVSAAAIMARFAPLGREDLAFGV